MLGARALRLQCVRLCLNARARCTCPSSQPRSPLTFSSFALQSPSCRTCFYPSAPSLRRRLPLVRLPAALIHHSIRLQLPPDPSFFHSLFPFASCRLCVALCSQPQLSALHATFVRLVLAAPPSPWPLPFPVYRSDLVLTVPRAGRASTSTLPARWWWTRTNTSAMSPKRTQLLLLAPTTMANPINSSRTCPWQTTV